MEIHARSGEEPAPLLVTSNDLAFPMFIDGTQYHWVAASSDEVDTRTVPLNEGKNTLTISCYGDRLIIDCARVILQQPSGTEGRR